MVNAPLTFELKLDPEHPYLAERGVPPELVAYASRKTCERALPALADAFFVRAPLLPDGEKPDTLPERALRELVAPDQ